MKKPFFVARELVESSHRPAGVRSAPKIFGAASRPSGSKLPRHIGAYASKWCVSQAREWARRWPRPGCLRSSAHRTAGNSVRLHTPHGA
ncbi:hypothetical protein DBR46_20450 [Pseudomonas sp. KBW05]|nr:hypothetical protein DBR46_20450 [Pseudomonas sp. KBW05]